MNRRFSEGRNGLWKLTPPGQIEALRISDWRTVTPGNSLAALQDTVDGIPKWNTISADAASNGSIVVSPFGNTPPWPFQSSYQTGFGISQSLAEDAIIGAYGNLIDEVLP